jgi:hypothetical protein
MMPKADIETVKYGAGPGLLGLSEQGTGMAMAMVMESSWNYGYPSAEWMIIC